MKRTRKLILALVVVMSLLMAMAVAIIPASAANNIPANTVLYLKPSNTWKTDGARFAAYFFGNGEAWVSMTDKDGDGVYECTSPNKSYTNVIFCRMNPNAAANNWNNKWNQTGNLTFDGNKNYYEPTEGWWDTMGDDCWTKHQCFDGPAATCETDQTCPLCGNVQKEKLGHSYNDGVVTTEPTCTEKGVKTFTCSTCEGIKTEDVASLGHNFVDGVCNRNGCDAEDPDYCAHSNVTHYEAKDATCTENGNIEYWLCVDCGQAWLDEAQTLNTNVLAVVLPTIDHSYKAVVTEPTCIKAGYTTYTCDCGDSYTEAGAAATGKHVYGENGKCVYNCGYVQVYAINTIKWDAVCCYCWNGTGNSWPGTAMTKTGETDINGCDVYVFETNCKNIIFNNNNKGAQTANLTANAGQYYDIKAAKWYASLDEVPYIDPLSTDRYILGSFNGWNTTANEFKLNAVGENIAYVTVTLEANTQYEIKIIKEGAWTSYNGTITSSNKANLPFYSSVSGNAKLNTECGGEYIFAYDLANNKLTVTYPDHEAGAAADCENAQTCTVCGTELVAALGHNHEACPHKAVVGGTYYETLQQAIAGAVAGGEIVLNSDIEVVGDLTIENQVTINLNGKTLTAGAVVTFYEGTKFIGEGKLEVAKNSLYNIKGETKYVPVWNAPVLGENDEVVTPGYYTFSEVKDQIKESTVEGTEVVVFRPAFENKEIKKEFVDGAGDNGLSFVISITWEGLAKPKEYTLTDDFIANVYNAENPKAIQLGFENWQAGVEYTVTLRIVSGGIYYDTTLCTMKDGAITVPEIVTE